MNEHQKGHVMDRTHLARTAFAFCLALCLILGVGRSTLAQDDDAPDAGAEDNVEIEFFIIGFDVDQSTAEQLQRVADAAGGQYVDARGGDELEEAFGQGLGVSTGVLLNAEVEPNNAFGRANLTGSNHSLTTTLLPAGDRDWFAFDVPEHGELQILIGPVAADLAVNLRVWTANKDTLTGWFAPMAAGGNTEATVDLPEPGRYYLEVAAGDGNQSSDQPFPLQTTFRPSPDAAEPNNAFGSAAALPLGADVPATILPAGDRDWYRFSVDQHGEVIFTATGVPADMAISMRVWNANKDTLTGWYNPLAAGGDTEAVVDLPAPGAYYLEVAAADGAQRSVMPYGLRGTFTPSPDAGDPNNAFGAAAELILGEGVPATILPAGDRDWYHFTIDHHGELTLQISDVPAEMGISARVWTANKDTLTGWYNPLALGGNTEAVIDLPAPGTYYLELAADTNGKRSVSPFQIRTTFVPAPDNHEPNNSFGAAAGLDLDDTTLINILPPGDRDWFVIDAPHHGALQIAASDVPAEMAVNLRVWTANKDALTGWFAPLAAGGNTEAVVDLPQPGRYMIEVAGGDNSQRDILPVRFDLNYTAAADQGEPNNAREQATPVNLDETIPANILPAGDRDWCVFEIPEAATLHILVVNSSPELTINFRLWDDANNTVTGWFAPLATGGNVSASVDIPEPGTYYLEVADGNRAARSIEPYLLRFSLEPIEEADLTELPDNRAATTFRTGSLTISQRVQTIVESIETVTISITRPESWVLFAESDTAYTFAPSEDEAAAAAAVGPRFRIAALDAPLTLADELAALDNARILFDPAPLTLGELSGEAATVEVVEQGVSITRQIAVATAPDGTTYQFVLEAPSGQWENERAILETMLNSIALEE